MVVLEGKLIYVEDWGWDSEYFEIGGEVLQGIVSKFFPPEFKKGDVRDLYDYGNVRITIERIEDD